MRSRLVGFALATLLTALPGVAQANPGLVTWAAIGGAPQPLGVGVTNQVPKELEGIGIDEKVGVQVPDVTLRDQDGRPIAFRSYLGKPTIVVLAYYACPMLCTLVLNGLKNGLREVAWTAGKEFNVVTVSFDPRDKVETAAAKRQTYLAAYGREIGPHGWDFLVGDEGEVRRLADALGFHYRWDADSQQFAHATAAFVLTPDGRLSRTLRGIVFPGRDLRLALVEASEGKLGTRWEQLSLTCFHYDPKAGSYVLATARLMQAAGAVTVVALGAFLLVMFRRERRRTAPGDPSDPSQPRPGPGDAAFRDFH